MTGREVPRFAVVTPYVAQWLLRQLASGERVDRGVARAHALWLRQAGQEGLAREVLGGWEQLEAAAGQWRAWAGGVGEEGAVQGRVSDGGNAETAVGAVEGSSVEKAQVTTKEAAGMLGVSERRVVQFVAAGLLGGRKVGRSWLLDRAGVEELRDVRRVS